MALLQEIKKRFGPLLDVQSPNFKTFKELKNWFQGTNSARLCSLADQYDNPILTWFLALNELHGSHTTTKQRNWKYHSKWRNLAKQWILKETIIWNHVLNTNLCIVLLIYFTAARNVVYIYCLFYALVNDTSVGRTLCKKLKPLGRWRCK